jgi:hypothetical protein
VFAKELSNPSPRVSITKPQRRPLVATPAAFPKPDKRPEAELKIIVVVAYPVPERASKVSAAKLMNLDLKIIVFCRV